MVGNNGTILHTDDGGRNWTQQTSNAKESLNSVAFVTPQLGWAVGNGGIVLRTQDGGSHWTSGGEDGLEGLSSVAFVSSQLGWAAGMLVQAGGHGIILHTEDGGKSWNSQITQINGDDIDQPISVTFATPQLGWAVGDNGAILHTEDGGKSWNPQASNTKESLLSIAFVTPLMGWVVGEGGAILHTDDGGKSWEPARYKRWLAPWFYLGVFLCCVGLVWACWPWTPPSRAAIEELANSDSPVTALKDDSLGYGPLVERLRRFIQNPRTAPPLVLSVQAPWGMGKSSIMRMLESELREKRAAVTVWFNAWHHQKEDQLLACLMEAVQKQAVPSWFTPIGFRSGSICCECGCFQTSTGPSSHC